MAIRRFSELRYLFVRICRRCSLFYRRAKLQEIQRKITLNAVGSARPSPVIQSQLSSSLLLGAIILKTCAAQEMSTEDKDYPDAEIIDTSQGFYDQKEYRKEYDYLVQHKDSSNANIQWRLARATRNLGQLSSTSADEKKELTYKALEYSKRALELDDKNFHSHKWYGISLSDVGDYEGNKAKLLNAYVMKEHFEKAIELNPKEATSRYLMGLWCFTFADMPWYQRKLASALFADPPTATYEESLKHFKDAEELEPNFYSMNLLMYGKTLLRMKDKQNAKLWLQKAVDFKAETEEDEKAQEEAKQLLKGC